MKKLILGSIIFILLAPTALGKDPGREEYRAARRLAAARRYDAACLKFQTIVKEYPASPHRKEALFALGEYYYQISAWEEGLSSFSEYLVLYPGSKNRDLAQVYLVKILNEMKLEASRKNGLIESLKKNLASSPCVLLFTEYKEAAYRSPLGNIYRLRYYLDHIEVDRNDEIFANIAF